MKNMTLQTTALATAIITASLFGTAHIARAVVTTGNWDGTGSNYNPITGNPLTTNDFTLNTNWSGDVLPPPGPATSGTANRTQLLIYNAGRHDAVINSPSDFATNILTTVSGAGSLTSPFSVTGTGTMTLSGVSSASYLANAALFDLTVDVATLNMSGRSQYLVSGDYTTGSGDAGTGNLVLGHAGGTMTISYSGGSTSNVPNIVAHNGGPTGNVGTSIIVYPKLDFTATTSSTTSNNINLSPESLSTIQLLGGITGGATPSAGNPTRSVRTNGSAGGKTILGDSTGWIGNMRIVTSDLEMNSSNSLGDAGSAAASYTEIQSGTNSGALRLNGNGTPINTSEYIYIYGRTTTDNPQIKNIKGNNTLAGDIATDSSITGYAMINSDGTALGDLLTISGNITRNGSGAGDLILQGAGNGVVSGSISQPGGGAWNSVTKSGTGTWTFSGANTYTGNTVVSNGTLVLASTGTIANSANVQVKSGSTFNVSAVAGGYDVPAGQTLAGSGNVTGSVTSSAGTINPGDNVIGTLNISNGLTLNSGSTLTLDLTSTAAIASGTNDKLVLGGALTANGGTVAVNMTSGVLGSGTYRLIDYTGAAVNAANFSLTGITLSPRQTSATLSSAPNQLNLDVVGGPAVLTWRGNNGNDWDVATTVNWTGASDNHFFNGDSVIFNGTATTLTPNVVGVVAPNAMTFSNGAGVHYTVSGDTINAGGPTTFSNAGDVTFNNASTTMSSVTASGSGAISFAGSFATTAVTGAMNIGGSSNVSVTNGGTFSAGSVTTTGSGTILFDGSSAIVSGAFTVGGSNNLNVTGSTSFTVGGAFTKNGTGTVTFSNSNAVLSLQSTVAINSGTVALDRTDDLTGGTAIATALTGAGTLLKQNTNTVEISGNNTGFSGTAVVAAGTLGTRSTNALTNTTVQSGATLDMGSTTTGAAGPGGGTKAISIVGNGVGDQGALTVTSAGPNSNGNNAHPGALTLAGDAMIRVMGPTSASTGRAILWVDGPVTGGGNTLTVITDNSIHKGTETNFVDNGNTNFGSLNLSGGGVFYFGGTTNLGAAGTITLGDPNTGTKGRLGIYGAASGHGAAISVSKPITVTSAGGGIEIDGEGASTYTVASPITLSSGDLDLSIVSRINGTSALSFSGAITGTGNLTGHTNSDSAARFGLIELTSNGNTYEGTTTIGGGGGLHGTGGGSTTSSVTPEIDRMSLSIGNGGATGSIGAGDITINSNGTEVSSLLLNRTGAYPLSNNIILNGSSDTAVIEAKAAGNVTLSGLVSGSGGIKITSSGATLAISGNSTYAGSTTINAGKLLVNGAHTGGGIYTVNTGGTLGGTGSVGSHVDVASGGAIAPGASTESLGIDSLTLASGSLLNFELGAPGAPGVTSDLINVVLDGGLTANGGTFNFTNAGGLAVGTYTLIDYTGVLGGAFGNLLVGAQPSGFSLTLSNNTGNTSIDVTVATAAGLLGDYNGNGKVDAADYVLWRKGGPLQNDPTPGNNPGDYAFWRARFGNTTPGSGTGSSLDNSGGAVPEPASCALLVCAAIGFLGNRRSRFVRSAR